MTPPRKALSNARWRSTHREEEKERAKRYRAGHGDALNVARRIYRQERVLVYLDRETAQELDKLARPLRMSRPSTIRALLSGLL